MKKFIVLFLSFLIIFNFCACSKNNNENTSFVVAYKLSKIENIDNLSDETIKALSVLCRSNLSSQSEINFDKNEIDKKLINLVNQTKNEKFKTNKSLNNFYNIENFEWTNKIKKSKLLELLADKNIYLSSISKITPINENSKTTSFDINEKIITFNTINSFCNFKSNNITKTNITDNEIIFYGNGVGNKDEGLNIEDSENLSKSGKNYIEILQNFDTKGQLYS